MSKIKTHNVQWVSNQTDWLLEQWARWARVNPGIALGYPGMTTFRRLQGSTLSEPVIDDYDAAKIDRVVSELKERNSDMWQAVTFYYFSNRNTSRVSRVMAIPHSYANTLIKSGIAWLDAKLCPEEAA